MAERMYPGLGTPIESGLPFDVGPGTRQAGMQMLSRTMDPNAGRIPSAMEVLFGMNPYDLQTRMAEQRNKMEQDYYSVPSTPGPGVPSPVDMAYNIATMRPENRLGPSASGRAEPALLTDEMVANYAAGRVGGGMFPWVYRSLGRTGTDGPPTMGGPPGPRSETGYPTFGMAPGGGPMKQLPIEVQREEERKTRDERLRNQPNIPTGPEDKSARHTIQRFNPPEGYPMPSFQGPYPFQSMMPFAF